MSFPARTQIVLLCVLTWTLGERNETSAIPAAANLFGTKH